VIESLEFDETWEFKSVTKYRIKLHGGRIIGPFTVPQIIELHEKKHIDGAEKFQQFPAGNWERVSSFPEIIEALKYATGFVAPPVTPSGSEGPVSDDVHESTEASRAFWSGGAPEASDKTRAMKKPTATVNDGTTIIPALKEERVPEKLEKTTEEEKPEQAEPIEPIVDHQAETRVADLGQELQVLHAAADAFHEEVKERELALVEQQAKLPVAESSESKIPPKKAGKKKVFSPIIAIVFLVVFYFVLFDKEEAPKWIIPVEISFPVRFEVASPQEADAAFRQALQVGADRKFDSMVKAADLLRLSLEYQFKDNRALPALIIAYAELLSNVGAQNRIKSATTIFQLMEINKHNLLTDPDSALGAALFFVQMGKVAAARKVIEDYLKIYPKMMTVRLMSVYLDVLMRNGDMVKAAAVYKAIQSVPDKTIETWLAMAEFQMMTDNYPEAAAILLKGISVMGDRVPLLLEYAGVLVHDEKFAGLPPVLAKIKDQNAEGSRRYYAKFLELSGVLAAVNKNTKEAVLNFRRALLIYDSEELRSKLAAVESSKDEREKDLIEESKAVDFMNRARKSIRERDLDHAFTSALRAVQSAPKYVPAQLLLAEIQRRQGYYIRAIETLVALQASDPTNLKIKYELVNSYIDVAKFDEANRVLQRFADKAFKETYEYASLMAHYFLRKNELDAAIVWFRGSLERNPLNDEDHYLLAQVYLRKRQYHAARLAVGKARDIDPSNVDHRVLYAKILYELDGADTAIGFLRDLLRDFPDNPKILGNIAIYYYQAGKTQAFEEYKDKVRKLPTMDKDLCQFMVQASIIEDRPCDVMKYSNELTRIEPGNLENRMLLVKYLYENRRETDAQGRIECDNKKLKLPTPLEELERIAERLPSYPMVNYYLSKIKADAQDDGAAISYAEAETKNNPSREEGFILLADMYFKMEKYDEAEENYKRALATNFRSIPALMGLARMKRDTNADEAFEMYERIRRYDSNYPYVYRELGEIYRRKGQLVFARENFELYKKMLPDAPDISEIDGIIARLKQ
jgi:tetratricopeptide (TPR) repeat protein